MLTSLTSFHHIERIVISQTEIEDTHLLALLRSCTQMGIKVSVLPQLVDAMGSSLEVDDVEGITLLTINPPVLSRPSRLIKRTLDIVVAAVLLVATAPFAAVIAVSILIDSRGSVFFRQQRVGRGGKQFQLVKFRTMVADAEARRTTLLLESEDPNWFVLEKDPRITRIGRHLRATSLDELPQLWNVLKGEMSLVGPRPLPVVEDANVKGWGRSRLTMQPGLTGLWQVLGRTTIPFDEMVKLDYLYVTNWSLWMDIRLMLRTPQAIFSRRGAT